jgi:hypothetical protein
MKKQTFNEFCYKNCDRLYEPRLSYDEQSTGYKQLRKMVNENITPASMEEMKRWEINPTVDELVSPPNIKYLRFLHVNLRPYIIEHWETIKNLIIT